jgi:DNA-binding MarR family transcriptional regulator
MDDKINPEPTQRPPSERLGFVLYRSGLAIARGFERALEPAGIVPTESGVLMTLAYQGPNHVRGLARLLGVGRQTIVNVTKRLDSMGLIARFASPADARITQFSITSDGQQKLVEIEDIAERFDARLRAITGEENETLIVDALHELLGASFLEYQN